jgi:hypothetical protein
METQLEALKHASGIPFERFVGKNLKNEEGVSTLEGQQICQNRFQGRCKELLTHSVDAYGLMGCRLSHMELWARANNSLKLQAGQPPYILILEDDADLFSVSHGAESLVANLCAQIPLSPEDAHIILLGWTNRKRPADDVGHGYYKASKPYREGGLGGVYYYIGMHAYLARVDSLGKMAKWLESTEHDVITPDGATQFDANTFHKYAVVPSLIPQRRNVKCSKAHDGGCL